MANTDCFPCAGLPLSSHRLTEKGPLLVSQRRKTHTEVKVAKAMQVESAAAETRTRAT